MVFVLFVCLFECSHNTLEAMTGKLMSCMNFNFLNNTLKGQNYVMAGKSAACNAGILYGHKFESYQLHF